MKLRLLQQAYIVTKYSFYGIILQCLFASMLIASSSYSQQASWEDIHVSLALKNITIKEALQEIEKLTDFSFAYPNGIIKDSKRVSLNVSNESLANLLRQMSEKARLGFKRVNNVIHIVKRTKKDPLVEEIIIVEKEISGKVTDENGEGLPGVNVLVKNTNAGTITDTDGNYKISTPDDATTLVFSYVGYLTEEVEIGTQTVINISLNPDISALSEVVIVGYGEQKKASLTSAVASVDAEEIQSIPTSQLSNSLAGRLPGVQIIQNSGLVGANSSINIRGTGVDPLYVIDNVISDKAQFDVLDPNEVETVTVLKDAAAAAIYGARASGGVIVITTKSGEPGKVVFNYSNIFTTNSLTKPLQDYSAEEEIIFMNNVATHRNLASPNPDPNFTPPFGNDVLDFARTIDYRTVNDEIWQSPTSQQHNLSVGGGSDKVTYFFSTGFNQAQGSYENTNFNRYNIRAKVDAKITDNVTLSTNISGNRRETDRFYWPFDGDNGEGFEVSDFYRATFNLSRLYPFYSRLDGTPSSSDDPEAVSVIQPGWGFNPAEIVNNDAYRRIIYNTFNGIINLNIDIPQVKGLSANIQGNYRQDTRNQKNFVLFNRSLLLQTVGNTGVDRFRLAPLVTDGSQDVVNNLGRSFEGIDEFFSLTESYQINGFIRYNNTFGDHSINSLLGFEQAESDFKGVNGTASELLSTSIDQILSASNSAERRTFNGGESMTGRFSYLGRLNYAYADKYIAEFSFRHDGSFKFPEGNRFGFFPSVSAAWRISEEEFFSVQTISNLKLRGSFGQTGFDGDDNRPIAPFQFQNNFVRASSYVFEGGLRDGIGPQIATPNPNITWETHTTWNAGLDVGLFDNKLDFTFDIFRNNITDILAPPTLTVPGTFGSSLPSTNVAERKINGFEIAVNYRKKAGDFDYSVGANMGYARDEWIAWPEAEGIADFQSRIGRPDDRNIGYLSRGIIRDQSVIEDLPENFTQFGRVPQPGEILFEDIRGPNFSEGPDGVVDENDQTILSENTAPRINYGIIGNVRWKGLSVDVFFQGVGAYDKYVSTRNTRSGGVFQQARPYFELWTDSWSADNPDGRYPRAENNWGQIENGHGPSTFWERNGAYIRLKNVNISYVIPKSLTTRIGIERFTVFVNGTNLFVISGFDEYDPEQEALDSYPIFKSFSGGINFSF